MTPARPAQNRVRARERGQGSAVLTVAGANVRTLAPKQEVRGCARISGCMLLVRVHALESQVNEAGPLIISVQEGGAKEEQLRAGVYYQMVVAAASESGSYGVQAWFQKSLGPEFLSVNVVSPRLMAVVVKLKELSVFVTLVVGRAPTSVSDLEVWCFFFFRQTGDPIFQMRLEFPRATVLMAIDVNARVGSVTCDSTGRAGAEKETDSGQLFRLMLDRTSMCAVNTHWGAGWTWQSTRRTTSRIDFVCCDAALGDRVRDCRVVGLVAFPEGSDSGRCAQASVGVDPCRERGSAAQIW